jgi:hypothetical protein
MLHFFKKDCPAAQAGDESGGPDLGKPEIASLL